MLAAALDTAAKAGIETVVDAVFAFDEAPAAYAHLDSGNHLGKIVVAF